MLRSALDALTIVSTRPSISTKRSFAVAEKAVHLSFGQFGEHLYRASPKHLYLTSPSLLRPGSAADNSLRAQFDNTPGQRHIAVHLSVMITFLPLLEIPPISPGTRTSQSGDHVAADAAPDHPLPRSASTLPPTLPSAHFPHPGFNIAGNTAVDIYLAHIGSTLPPTAPFTLDGPHVAGDVAVHYAEDRDFTHIHRDVAVYRWYAG